MLKDEPIEYIREQYDEKNMVLSQYGEQVNPYTLYEDIFGDMQQEIPVVVIGDENDNEKTIRKMSIEDAVSFGLCRNDVLIGGCTYFNCWISKKSAKDIHTFIIDYDNAYSGTLLNALRADWRSGNGEPFAKPTYIVNSGTGLHLYFVLTEPIPNYHNMTANIDRLYRELAIQQSRRVYCHRQVQWFGQDFRCAGGLNKYDWENTVFRVGEKWDADALARAVGLDLHFTRYGEKRTQKPQERKHKRRQSEGWKTNRAFYDYSLKTCIEKTHEGNRYMSMCALSAIAYKCGVDRDELERDLNGLLPEYNKKSERKVTVKEIRSAMKMYNSKAALTPRESLEHWQGWEYKPIKRNGRKQAEHLKRARLVQTLDYPDGEWRGKQSKQDIVLQWQRDNPEGRKCDCIRDLGVDRKTVSKYWRQDSTRIV